MFFFIFDSLWTSVTFGTSITEDQSEMLWKENNSNFHIPITQNINFPPFDGFSQVTSHIHCTYFWLHFHPPIYTYFLEKALNFVWSWRFLIARFYDIPLKIHQTYGNWMLIYFDENTHPLRSQNTSKSTPKGRHINIFHVNVTCIVFKVGWYR